MLKLSRMVFIQACPLIAPNPVEGISINHIGTKFPNHALDPPEIAVAAAAFIQYFIQPTTWFAMTSLTDPTYIPLTVGRTVIDQLQYTQGTRLLQWGKGLKRR